MSIIEVAAKVGIATNDSYYHLWQYDLSPITFIE